MATKHEIRLRNVPPQLMKQAEQMQAHFNVNTLTAVLEKLIPGYLADQVTIKTQEKEIEDLEKKNETLEAREADAKNLVYQFKDVLQQVSRLIKNYDGHSDAILNRFSKAGKKKVGQKKSSRKTRSQRSQRPGKKVSHKQGKKGGKK